MIGEFIRRSIALIVVLLAIGGVYYYYVETRPCAHPLEYRIGTIDSRFRISREQFITDIEKAAKLWSDAAGKDLFTYVESGGMPVYLVFDERQQTANQGAALSTEGQYYDIDRARVDQERAAYEKASSDFNKEVTYWNTHGGASKAIADKLNAEQVALAKQQQKLNADIAGLNTRARNLNIKVDTFNESADTTFEAGIYRKDARGATIEVYEFTNETQLERLLAHELGHSLGLEHTLDPKAIMYPLNSGTSVALASADRDALKQLCNLK